ncbi:unnamed protein product [Linum trigynum]|uniref:Uncharacterized protein n=1 Tax=Linum trigynum TaxID=586398 RepID=A0AAV2G5X2_9ROSI
MGPPIIVGSSESPPRRSGKAHRPSKLPEFVRPDVSNPSSQVHSQSSLQGKVNSGAEQSRSNRHISLSRNPCHHCSRRSSSSRPLTAAVRQLE